MWIILLVSRLYSYSVLGAGSNSANGRYQIPLFKFSVVPYYCSACIVLQAGLPYVRTFGTPYLSVKPQMLRGLNSNGDMYRGKSDVAGSLERALMMEYVRLPLTSSRLRPLFHISGSPPAVVECSKSLRACRPCSFGVFVSVPVAHI